MAQKLIAILKQSPKLTAKLTKTYIHEYPELENIEITPSTKEQVLKSENYYGYNEIKVKSVDISEMLQITDCSYLFHERARMDCYDALISLCKNITNTQYMFYNSTITEAPELDTSNVSNMANMFYGCRNLTYIPKYNTENVKNMGNMFRDCSKLSNIPLFDTKNATNMASMFYRCNSLLSIPLFNMENVTDTSYMLNETNELVEVPCLDMSKNKNISNMFRSCSSLTTLGGFKNLGKGFTQKSNNYGNYALNLSVSTLLTHESLMNVINNLYDLNLTYNVANGGILYRQSLVLGSTNKAKLTEEEIAIATNKGWNVS